jgi:hypothetical protein
MWIATPGKAAAQAAGKFRYFLSAKKDENGKGDNDPLSGTRHSNK